MKQTTKNFLKVFLIVILSAGVAGYTSYSMLKPQQENLTYEQMFPANPNVKLASYEATAAQPVDLTYAAEVSLNAVVHIKATQAARTRTVRQMPDIFEFFFGPGAGGQREIQSQPQVGYGSGVIISRDGYIVTNNHVIENSDELDIALNDNRTFKGRLIGTDPNTDLALIKIEGNDFPTLTIGDSDALKVGEWVLAVGNPFNLTSTVTAGIVSAKARSLGVYGRDGVSGIESFIQTDAAINRGNSGGALVNAEGELVGINAVLSSPTGSFAGYGFAIPTSIMTKVVADLKQYGTVQRAILGIMGGDNSADLSKEKDLGVVDGVYVSNVVEGGSAADAGIKENDVIIAIDNKTVRSMASLQETLAQYRPGDKVKVKIVRDKKERTLDLVLKNSQGTTKVVKNVDMEILGAAFQELPDDLKKQLNLNHGLQVSGVSKGKMQDAGVRKGFIILRVNGQQMNTLSDMEDVFRKAMQSQDQVLFITGIFPSGKRASFAVDLSDE